MSNPILPVGARAYVDGRDTVALDAATKSVTAFQTFEELVTACRVNGYVPTLIPRGSRQHAKDITTVTQGLQALGYRVYSGTNNTR